ncbi:MAG: hypothetical protein Q8L87_02560 [Anaerolineales bacterium]|jgi:hypothetical protein|nr:hypothetical protein [Anaerolineales bacterium]
MAKQIFQPRRGVIHFFLLAFYFLASCASPTPTAPTSTITAYASSSAQPWMDELFACANEQSILVNVTANEPDIYLRLGEPAILASPAYQIDEEEILIVVNRESSTQNLSLEEAQALFAGQGNESVQVWVYASGLDVQGVFDQFVMAGRSVTSLARVAAGPQEMSDVLNSEPNAIGILPKHWMVGNVREVYSLGKIPVLAITREEPQGALKALLGCMQNN